MRKTLIGLATFLLTLFVGLGFHGYFTYTHSEFRDRPFVDLNVASESKQANGISINAEPTNKFYLAPCEIPDAMTQRFSFPKSKTINGGVVNKQIMCGVLPEYPVNAQGIKESGIVTLDVLIDPDGEIVKASVKSGNPSLCQAALKAAYQSQTPPRFLRGEPVKIRGILIYQFDSKLGASLPIYFPITAKY